MPEDDTIGRIIRRDLDRLPMLPTDRWVPRAVPRRSFSFAWLSSTVAIALALILAVGVGQGIRGLREGSTPLSASNGETFILANPTGLLVLDAQGQVLRHVVDLPANSQPSTPSLNQQRTAVTFTLTQTPKTATGFGSDIYAVNVDGTGLRALVEHESDGVFYASPVIDPSNNYVYFSRRAPVIQKGVVTGNDDTIQRLDLRTGERRMIITGGVDPTISSDSKVLVYIQPAGARTTDTLWRANSDGTNAAPLFAPSAVSTTQLFLVQSPRIAPGRCEVAFSGILQSGGSGTMFIAPCDGSSLRALGSASQHGAPAWSPDGAQLAYVSAGTMYVIDLTNGNGVVRTVGFANQDFTFGDVAWLRAPAVATSPSPRPTGVPVDISPFPLPVGIVDPRPLIDQATHLGSVVLRVDRASARLATMSDFTNSTGASPGRTSDQSIWVIAIRGDIRIDAIVDLPHAQCALFAYDAATGEVRASRSGPASICDPYFK